MLISKIHSGSTVFGASNEVSYSDLNPGAYIVDFSCPESVEISSTVVMDGSANDRLFRIVDSFEMKLSQMFYFKQTDGGEEYSLSVFVTPLFDGNNVRFDYPIKFSVRLYADQDVDFTHDDINYIRVLINKIKTDIEISVNRFVEDLAALDSELVFARSA